jgi:hypothetical protein
MLEGSHCRQGLCNGIGFDQSLVCVGYVVGINIAIDVTEQAYMIYPFCTT